MNRFLLFILTLTIPYSLHAQKDDVVTFEKPLPYLCNWLNIDTTYANNKWQIGRPQKILFDTAASGKKVIITDTVNYCTSNDTSIFTIQFKSTALSVSLYGLGFIYKADIDTTCILKVEVLYANKTWINLTDTPYIYKQFDSVPSYNNFVKPDTPNLHISSLQWKLVQFNTRAALNAANTFRFTFITGNTTQNLEGWMIDDIFGIYLVGGNVESVKQNVYTCYPNPSKGRFSIKGNSYQNVTMEITDVLGRTIYHDILQSQNNTVSNYVDITGKPAGIYYLKLNNENSAEIIKLQLEN